MIELLRKFFGKSTNKSSSARQQDTSHDVRIATCALLLEMANIDGKFSETERESIIRLLRKDYQLPVEHATALIQAADEELKRSIDLWQFARLINQNYSTDEKLQIIEMIWRIVYADGRLDKHEDYLVHKLANLLRLTHKQLINAKVKVIQVS